MLLDLVAFGSKFSESFCRFDFFGLFLSPRSIAFTVAATPSGNSCMYTSVVVAMREYQSNPRCNLGRANPFIRAAIRVNQS